MIRKELIKIINVRKKLNLNDDFRTEKCWENEAKIMLRNLDETIQFIQNDCSDELFYWLSEVFDDVVRESQNYRFLEAIRKRNEKLKNSELRKSVETDINFAAQALEPE